ncbi:sugar-binding domain-containing protein [Oceaniferula marina]|nr:sugar-binding domain-containing protein [Oceaniferula marina]
MIQSADASTRRTAFDDGWSYAPAQASAKAIADGGVAWHGRLTKEFRMPESASERKIYLEFEDVRDAARVSLNGQVVGEWTHGYRAFRMDVTPYLRFGAANVLQMDLGQGAVSDEDRLQGRVWLINSPMIHIAHWGTYITTPEVDDQQATVEVETTIDNGSGKESQLVVRTEILDQGQVVASRDSRVRAKQTGMARAQLTVLNPKRWDGDNQHLYTLRTTLFLAGKMLDRKETAFGIRRTEWNVHHRVEPNGMRGLILADDLLGGQSQW